MYAVLRLILFQRVAAKLYHQGIPRCSPSESMDIRTLILLEHLQHTIMSRDDDLVTKKNKILYKKKAYAYSPIDAMHQSHQTPSPRSRSTSRPKTTPLSSNPQDKPSRSTRNQSILPKLIHNPLLKTQRPLNLRPRHLLHIAHRERLVNRQSVHI